MWLIFTEILSIIGIELYKYPNQALERDWAPQEADKDAAWDMYVELLTRITTQPLSGEDGLEKPH